jgi:thiol-disulfide isomerase/thioredoxin
MRLIITTVCFIFFLFSSFSQEKALPVLKKGQWTGKLQLNPSTTLPFEININGKKKGQQFIIINGEEQIVLEKGTFINDSIHYVFPAFNSELILHKKNRKKLVGYWINYNKGKSYTIPVAANYGFKKRFPVKSESTFPYVEGNWETTFDPKTADSSKALGIFHQKENRVQGTFLTETGDFRYLDGNVSKDSLFLSCFDGSHAYLITGKITGDSIYGSFYSGKHWLGKWNARCNDAFQLSNPDSLTYIVDESKEFTFTLKDLSNNVFTFPNKQYKNKVTIIQIMGTWCPNCMDETKYFKEIYGKYHNSGLEIISVAYEVGNSFEDYVFKINRLKERYDLDYQFLIGGSANKGLASEQFSMLNQIISFPTAIFIDRNGQVRKVHTGFNGPGTGEYYTDYTKETELFLLELLKED